MERLSPTALESACIPWFGVSSSQARPVDLVVTSYNSMMLLCSSWKDAVGDIRPVKPVLVKVLLSKPFWGLNGRASRGALQLVCHATCCLPPYTLSSQNFCPTGIAHYAEKSVKLDWFVLDWFPHRYCTVASWKMTVSFLGVAHPLYSAASHSLGLYRSNHKHHIKWCQCASEINKGILYRSEDDHSSKTTSQYWVPHQDTLPFKTWILLYLIEALLKLN